jgi:superfamily II DNA or RNA helicase
MPETGTSIINVGERYDAFQSEAVESLLRDFGDKANGRFLLVIPTGGGKTNTAVKAIHEMFVRGVLKAPEDVVLWAAHRVELQTQARDCFAAFEDRTQPDYEAHIDVVMMSQLAVRLKADPAVKLVVIDEAHHAATTNIQYGPVFDYPSLGILGLTATPSRHDGQPLEFERESYSIGFPDLVEKQVILSPVVRQIDGERFDSVVPSGSGFSGLESLATEARDEKIIAHIRAHSSEYDKIIIYAASTAHVKVLFDRLKSSDVADEYESVDYIVSGEFSQDDTREDFVARIKSYSRSIIVNHDVLTEGFDDIRVNTVVMARPSRSKLVYMQAIGRAIRVDPTNADKTAYIVEVEDDLPNIHYRINNRWLFSDISDTLEPEVRDEYFANTEDLKRTLESLYSEMSVPEKLRVYPQVERGIRYSLLLFRYYVGDGQYEHIPIMIANENRQKVSNWFNFLSERLASYRTREFNGEEAMRSAGAHDIEELRDRTSRLLVYDCLEEASKAACGDGGPTADVGDWVCFVSLRERQTSFGPELSEFLREMVNRDHIEREVTNRSYEIGARLLRFPLPLAGFLGLIVTRNEFERLFQIVSKLEALRDVSGLEDHRHKVRDLLDASILPVGLGMQSALPVIVRENIAYHMELE